MNGWLQDAQVNMLGTVPSLVRTWRGSGCMANLDWSSVRYYPCIDIMFTYFSSCRLGVVEHVSCWQEILPKERLTIDLF
jgi:hypothetical protein